MPDFGWIPPDQRDAKTQRRHEQVVAGMPTFAIYGDSGYERGTRSALWEFSRKLLGKDIPNVAQQTGDCVSFGGGNCIDYVSTVEIIRNGEPEQWRPAFRPFLYFTGRVMVGGKGRGAPFSGAGSLGSWQAEAVQKYGCLFADEPNVPAYSEGLADDWGDGKGDARKWLDFAAKYLVRSAAPLRSAKQVTEALHNCYAVTIASSWGGRMEPRVVDGRLVNEKADTWNHQMAVIAQDETGKEPYWYVLNSWGPDVHGKPPDDSPPGGFWIREDDMEWICKDGEVYAYSQFDGFPAQSLTYLLG